VPAGDTEGIKGTPALKDRWNEDSIPPAETRKRKVRVEDAPLHPDTPLGGPGTTLAAILVARGTTHAAILVARVLRGAQ
jgi:hypothetical protein